MKEIIEQLPTSTKADYLLDTCFIIYEFQRGNQKHLEKFCEENKVGICSFNLEELDHVSKKLPGPISRHLRDFLKDANVSNIPVDVHPGQRDAERSYVESFDPKVLHLVPDASDAVLFVLALKIKADVLTRDKHHIFTAIADNYSDDYGVKVLNKLP